MREKLKQHKLAIVLALIVGAIYASHHFFIYYILVPQGLQYNPLVSESFDENMYYFPRAWSAYRGDYLVGDFSVVEYQDGPLNISILNPLLIGGLGWLAGSFEVGIILADVVFPALIFFSIYLVFYEFTQRKKLSVFTATIFMFAPLLAMNLPPLSVRSAKELFNGLFPLVGSDLYFARWEYPQATYFLYAVSIYFLYRALRLRKPFDVWAAGVSTGGVFYTYFYDWTYIATSLFILFLIMIFDRRFKEAAIIAKIAFIALVVSVFYWINLLKLHSLPQFGDIVLRMGVEISHRFRLWTVWKSYLRIIALSFLLWRMMRIKNRLAVSFITAFLLTYFIVVNMQVVVGFNPQPDHWYRELLLMVALAFILLFQTLLERYLDYFPVNKKILIAGCAVFLTSFLLLQLRNQYQFAKTNANVRVLPKNTQSYVWLNSNTEKNSVVGSPLGTTGVELQLYTHNKTFLPNGFVTLASTDEIWERAMLMGKIFNVSPEIFMQLSSQNNHYYLFVDQYRNNSFDTYFGGGNRILPPDIYRNKLNQYKELEINSELLKKYRLDYLYFGPSEQKFGSDPHTKMKELKEIYKKDDVIIYKL